MRLAQTMTDILTNKTHTEKQMRCAPADTKLTNTLTHYTTRLLHRVKEELCCTLTWKMIRKTATAALGNSSDCNNLVIVWQIKQQAIRPNVSKMNISQITSFLFFIKKSKCTASTECVQSMYHSLSDTKRYTYIWLVSQINIL